MSGLSRERDNGRSGNNISNTHVDHMADAGEGIVQCNIALRRQSYTEAVCRQVMQFVLNHGGGVSMVAE